MKIEICNACNSIVPSASYINQIDEIQTQTMRLTLISVQEFIDSPKRTSWVEDEFISIYLRKGFHVVTGAQVSTLDIANVTATVSGNRTFTRLLEGIEAQVMSSTTLSGVYIENVQTDQFAQFFNTRGYICVTPDRQIAEGIYPCFYKAFNHD